MDQEKIIDKILKCLRLSESCNPNEAAAALRQAHGLMQKYQISEHQICASQVSEKAIEAQLSDSTPFWMLALLNLVADAFDCRGFVDRNFGARIEFRFIGIEPTPEVATYSFTVLLRSLEQARDAFVSELTEVGDENERERRIAVFMQAWLFRVARTVETFVSKKSVSEAVDSYVKTKYGDTTDVLPEQPAAEPQEQDYGDILSGLRAADAVSLFTPVENPKNRPAQLYLDAIA